MAAPDVKPEIVKHYDIDALIDRITDYARDWTANGIDLYPDGVEQFRAGLYPIFGIPVPPGSAPVREAFCPHCGSHHK